MTHKKWTPKRAKNAFFVVLNSKFPTEKGKMCCFSLQRQAANWSKGNFFSLWALRVLNPKKYSRRFSAYGGDLLSAVPKRGCSKRGWTQKHANACKRAQTQVRKRAQRAQKGAKERIRVKIANNQVFKAS